MPVGDVLADVWERSTTTQAPPHLAVVAALGVIAVIIVASPAGYRGIRHGITVLHEAGHAVLALMVGRRLSGIRLHSDTSGVTVSRGRARGPGMVATLLAGYPTPALVALGATVVLNAGYAVGVLWAVVVVSAAMALFVRNLYGFVVLLFIGGGVAVVSWTVPAVAASGLAYLLVWTLLLSAPRSVLELSAQRRRSAAVGRRDASSDAAQLAALTGVPAPLWVASFMTVTVVCAVAGIALMLMR
ncbi:MAG: M50 family metallopeptidase [Ornithinimicrobium sp.]